MTSRTPAISLVALVLLVLSACSAAGGADETSSIARGTIELAVSETCTDGSDPQCVSVNGQSVLSPSAFERAGVENAAVAEGEGRNAVDVTFNAEGTEIFHALTEKAAQAGSTARLVMKFGDEMRAVAVPEAIERDQVQIMLSPDEDAQELVDLIHGG